MALVDAGLDGSATVGRVEEVGYNPESSFPVQQESVP